MALKRGWMRLLTAMVAGGFLGCATTSARLDSVEVRYQFEPEPRAVLEPLGVERARYPKLATSSTRGASGSVQMLAVVDEGDQSHLRLFVSDDSGDTFEFDGDVSPAEADVKASTESSPTYVVGHGAAAVWEQAGALVFARAVGWDSPRHFFEPLKLPVKERPSMNSFATLARAPDGALYVVWLDGREGPVGVYLRKSVDGGETFGPNVQVEPSVCPCCRPTVAFGANGAVHVAWRHVFEGNIRDIVVATSLDGGQVFEDPVRVAEDGWMIEGCPDVGPAMAQQGDRLYIAWYTKDRGDMLRVRLSWSDDSGASFAPAVDASGDVADPTRPHLSASPDGHTALVFQGREPATDGGAWNPVVPFLVDISESGKVSPPTLVPGTVGNVSGVVVEAGQGGRAFLAWTERRDGRDQAMFTRARRFETR